MRIDVSSRGAFAPQILAYAEYRLFSALARYAGIRSVRVALFDEQGGGVRCSVTIDFDAAAPARTRVRGRHAAGTIDRAAQLVVRLMRRRVQPEVAAAPN